MPGKVRTGHIGYSGNWTDPTTSLVYLRARDYDPATAQFLTVDPKVDTTRQPYAYVANDPLASTDPTGLDDSSFYNPFTSGFWTQGNIFSAPLQQGLANCEDLWTAANMGYNPFDVGMEKYAASRSAGNDVWSSANEGFNPFVTMANGFYNESYDSASGASSSQIVADGIQGVSGLAGGLALAAGGGGLAGLAEQGLGGEILSAKPSDFTATERLSAKADLRTVRELAEAMRANGWQGAPIDVVEINGEKLVVDGHHRVAAAKLAGINVPYQIVDPASVIRPGKWSSTQDILNGAAMAGGWR